MIACLLALLCFASVEQNKIQFTYFSQELTRDETMSLTSYTQ
jgi:hypothetical protein